MTPTRSLTVSDTSIPIPDITPGIQTSEGQLTIAGVAISAVGLLFAIINPRFGTHLILTGTERTVISSIATAAAPTLVAWYAQVRASLKKYQIGAASAIIQQQIVAAVTPAPAPAAPTNPGGVVDPVPSPTGTGGVGTGGNSTAIL